MLLLRDARETPGRGSTERVGAKCYLGCGLVVRPANPSPIKPKASRKAVPGSGTTLAVTIPPSVVELAKTPVALTEGTVDWRDIPPDSTAGRLSPK